MLEFSLALALWAAAVMALGIIAGALGEGLSQAQRILSDLEPNVRGTAPRRAGA